MCELNFMHVGAGMVPGTFAYEGLQYYTCDNTPGPGADGSVGNCEANFECIEGSELTVSCKFLDASDTEVLAIYEDTCGPALAGQAYGVFIVQNNNGACPCTDGNVCIDINATPVCAPLFNCATNAAE